MAREVFAEKLRGWGIEAEASSQVSRGTRHETNGFGRGSGTRLRALGDARTARSEGSAEGTTGHRARFAAVSDALALAPGAGTVALSTHRSVPRATSGLPPRRVATVRWSPVYRPSGR